MTPATRPCCIVVRTSHRRSNQAGSGFFLEFFLFASQSCLITCRPRPSASALRRNSVGDHAARANVAVRADFDGRDQRRIAADERACADFGLVLLLAVEIAGDGARADVDSHRRSRVAQISQVLALGACAEAACSSPRRNCRRARLAPIRAFIRRRANGPICAPAFRSANRRSGCRVDDHAIGQHRTIRESTPRRCGNPRQFRWCRASGVNGSMTVSAPTCTCASMVTVSGRSMVTPASISSSVLRCAQDAIGIGQLDARIDSEQFARIVDMHRLDAMAVARQNLGHIGQIKFARGIVGLEFRRCASTADRTRKQ